MAPVKGEPFHMSGVMCVFTCKRDSQWQQHCEQLEIVRVFLSTFPCKILYLFTGQFSDIC